ncbi:MAG: dihydroorotase [Cyclobacteriaceae bacterium]
MNHSLKNVLVKDSTSQFNDCVCNIDIENGFIKKIEVIDAPSSGVIVTNSFIDLDCELDDPGNEHKEDIRSGLQCAEAGGFSAICPSPNTNPATDSKSNVEYLQSRGSNYTSSVIPFGSISKGCEGKDLSEMLDLESSGVRGFTDGKPIENSELLLKALQYAQKFDGLIIDRPMDRNLSYFGQINEGKISTYLGMRGIPNIAEYLVVERDLSILRYAGGKLHLSGISCKESVDLIKAAKKSGLNITCDVGLFHLMYDEETIEPFDTLFKVMPPFRSLTDQKALFKGLKDGTIDAVTTQHRPQDQESKALEFDLADFGLIGLQTTFPVINALKTKCSIDLLIEKLSHGPRKVLGIDPVKIDVGATAEIAVFDESSEWELDGDSNLSKSKNTPLFGTKLKGSCIGLINGDKSNLSQ